MTLTMVLLLSLFACGVPTPIPNPPLVLGENYLSELDYEQALLQFDQAIEIEPKNPRGYLGKADALLHLDRQAEAASALATGAKATRGDTRAALKAARAKIEKSPIDGYIGLSACYERLGWREIALLLLRRVCEEMPEETRLRETLEGLMSIGENETLTQNEKPTTAELGEASPTRWSAEESGLIEYSYSNLSYEFDWTVDYLGNQDALGGCILNFTLVGDLDDVAAVLIAIGTPVPSLSIDTVKEMALEMPKLWKNENWVNHVSEPFDEAVLGQGFPIMDDDLGVSGDVLLLALNHECEAIGYVLVPVSLPATAG